MSEQRLVETCDRCGHRVVDGDLQCTPKDSRLLAAADPWADVRARYEAISAAVAPPPDGRAVDAMFESVKDVPALLAALDAVRARHFQQVGGLPSCYFDGEAFYPCARCGQRWPCETTRDIAAALDGAP